jgi:hypothetical protein
MARTSAESSSGGMIMTIRSMHRAAARLLIAGYEPAHVAGLIGVGRSRLEQWMANPTFQDFLARLEGRTHQRWERARQNDGLPLDRLELWLNSGDARLRQQMISVALAVLAGQPAPTKRDDMAVTYRWSNDGS